MPSAALLTSQLVVPVQTMQDVNGQQMPVLSYAGQTARDCRMVERTARASAFAFGDVLQVDAICSVLANDNADLPITLDAQPGNKRQVMVDGVKWELVRATDAGSRGVWYVLELRRWKD